MNFRSLVKAAAFAAGIVVSISAAQAFPSSSLGSVVRDNGGGAIVEKAQIVIRTPGVMRRRVVVGRPAVVVRRPAIVRRRPAIIVR